MSKSVRVSGFSGRFGEESFSFRFVVKVILVLCLIVSNFCFVDKAVRALSTGQFPQKTILPTTAQYCID